VLEASLGTAEGVNALVQDIAELSTKLLLMCLPGS
jgi:hypothetical protein